MPIKTNKNAQFLGQALVYVLMIIVFAAVLLFGYKSIRYIVVDLMPRLEIQALEKQMDSLVNSNIQYGTSEAVVMSLPKDYEEICFIDSCYFSRTCDLGTEGLDESSWNKYGTNSSAPNGKTHNSIKDSIESGSKNNVFLYPKLRDDEFQVEHLIAYHQCELNNGACPSMNNMIKYPFNPKHIDAPHKNFICMPIIDGKVRLRLKGYGDKVEIVQLPFYD